MCVIVLVRVTEVCDGRHGNQDSAVHNDDKRDRSVALACLATSNDDADLLTFERRKNVGTMKDPLASSPPPPPPPHADPAAFVCRILSAFHVSAHAQ